MRTPTGTECAFFYEDFHRGRDIRTCRVRRSPRSAPWSPDDCTRCPIPAILLANGSPDLELTLTIRRGFFRIGGGVKVAARCARHGTPMEDPYVGCRSCVAEQMSGIDQEDGDV